MSIQTEYLAQHDGNRLAAAIAFAHDLMQGDPATLKAGYSLDNAILAAEEMFPQVDVNLCVSFEPQAIRDHFEGNDHDPTEGLGDEHLKQIGEYAVSADPLWELFHELLVEAFEEVSGPEERSSIYRGIE
jgi:hypothetical protein